MVCHWTCIVDAQKSDSDPVKPFGVIFSKNPPDWSEYGIPVLWRKEGIAGVGRWSAGQLRC
jgi:hypothetical protein